MHNLNTLIKCNIALIFKEAVSAFRTQPEYPARSNKNLKRTRLRQPTSQSWLEDGVFPKQAYEYTYEGPVKIIPLLVPPVAESGSKAAATPTVASRALLDFVHGDETAIQTRRVTQIYGNALEHDLQRIIITSHFARSPRCSYRLFSWKVTSRKREYFLRSFIKQH
jgi:hypothetical protein